MIKSFVKLAASAAVLAAFSVPASAAVIDFTNGTATLTNATSVGTPAGTLQSSVDYYVENGFKLDFIGGPGYVGNYYGGQNNVIHSHWSTGNFGGVTAIEISKVGGGTFDLNYFILTSNTDTGGGAASGNERAFVEGFVGNVSTGAAVQLPPENWGFPATQIFLGSAFDAVDKVRFYVTNSVDCFGMDEFYIDEAAPPSTRVPEPMSLALVGMALVAAAAARRRA